MIKKSNTKMFAVIIGIVIIAGFISLTNRNSTTKVTYYGDAKSNSVAASTNVSTEGKKQIIEITAKGGYSPPTTIAKAGVPTILRMKTNGTYDCSSTLRIKSLNYNNNLPATGTTDIEVPPQAAGATIAGLCGMGMFHFSISFNS